MLLKRWGCLLLALCLVSGLGLAQEGKSYVMAGFDDGATYRTWDTNLFFARMQEKTGVSFVYRQFTEADAWAREKAGMTAAGELPDVLFKAELTSADGIALLDSGVLIDLAPLIDEHCPNLSALLTEHPEWRDAITLPDGRIAALPYIDRSPMQNILWINQSWLTALKLDMPTDIASLTEVMRAFQTGDPNRNGKKDEIALAFLGPYDLKYLAHGFGLTANDFNLFAQGGEARFMPLEDDFRSFIAWCRDAYAERLLDKNGFTTNDSLRRVTDDSAAKVYGMLFTTMISNVLPVAWSSEYVAVPPLVYKGARVYRSVTGQVLRGAFAVTSACDDPALMLSWVDTLYSEEGSRLASVGLEGVDYVLNGDGTWRVSDAASANNYFTAETLITSGGTAPGVSCDEFQRQYTDSQVGLLSDQINAVNQVAALPFPLCDLTHEQLAYITPLQSAIGKYVDVSIAQWVLGEREISDEEFNTFEETLRELGLDEFMRFWQGILDAEGTK